MKNESNEDASRVRDVFGKLFTEDSNYILNTQSRRVMEFQSESDRLLM